MAESMISLYANFDWLTKHSTEVDKYAGKWIAIAEQKLIAVADTLKELMEKPEVKRIKEPFVMQIPTPEDAYAIL